MRTRSGAGLLAMVSVLSVTASAAPPPAEPTLPDPLAAGWQGHPVCELLKENAQLRTLRCTFPPGGGQERHRHAPHWGYILSGSTMAITTASGTVVRTLKAGDTWWSDGFAWHEVRNVGDTTGIYLVVEPKPSEPKPSDLKP